MFGWSPPNILATLVLSLSLLLLFDRSPTQAKPYRKEDSLNTYTAGNLGEFHEGDWPELVNYKNGHYIGRDKRSPTEVEDESPNSNEGKPLNVNPGKRQGIETPIEPLTSESGLDKDTFSHLNSEENVRSKVDQPESEATGVPVEEEKKAVDNTATETSTAQHQQESTDDAKSNTNEGQEKERVSSSSENVNGIQTQGNNKADSSSGTANNDQSTEGKNSANVEESKAAPSRPAEENAQVRSIQENDNENKKLGNVPNDKNAVKFPGSSAPVENISGVKVNSQEAQTTTTNNGNKQTNADEPKITTAKVETPVTTTTSKDQNTAAVAGNNADSSAATTHSTSQESSAIHTVSQMPNVPVRDALGNSGSEIVTTRGASELDSYPQRDAESKESNGNGPEVGHFQVDDKSADLEINANSAGVKVKAKPASLQVVSRPGSHSPSAAAQERSFYPHYHYPPYHPQHHWYPGMRRSFGQFHRRHFLHPYHSFAERRGFDNYYDEAPFYRRRMHYWYPHRRRHHFHESDLYERSRMEEPDDYPKYHRRRRHKRRFRHMNGPFKRQFYNNIPIMNGMESPQMGMTPEEGTMPQLPIGGGVPFSQRQNVITPMPPPINVVGNPPAGLLGGINAASFAMNPMNALNNFNGANQMNNLNAFNGLGGMNSMNTISPMGFNSLGSMGNMEGVPAEINGGMEGMGNGEAIPGAARALSSSNANPPSESPRMAFKKTAILSNTKNKSATKEHSHDETFKPKKNTSKVNLEKDHSAEKIHKGKVNLKSWEKTLKRYHRPNVFTSKKHERHQYRRNTKSSGKLETKKTDETIKRKHGVSHLHAQHTKDVKGNRKNAIVMHRPPIIYHPPPEIYHRPDIVVHRAPIMLHRPPIIYHQPPVVVHRPAIIYHQPPIVFHQPPPVVHQPIMHSHDTWVTKPMVYHTASMVSHAKTYFGIPSHVYSGEYGEGCHGAHCSYRKEKVPHGNVTHTKNITEQADHKKKTKRDSFGDYMAYVTSLWKPSRLRKREIDDEWNFITSTEGAKEKLAFRNMDGGAVNKRDTINSGNSKVKRDTKDGTQKKKKKDVVVNRPPIIYHPPPEIYHRPDIVVHRPPLVIHRPPIIYHQPPVIVHRPAVVYHQPPIVFHQPPPAVSQPLLYSHDSFTVHPSFYASHHGSVVRDFGHYLGVPNVITNYGNPLFGRGPPMGKRSVEETTPSTDNTTKNSDNSTAASKRGSLENKDKKQKNETSEKAGKKNTVLVHRPPIIYHPPPEIYHRPVIVVHRPPIMIHRAPIFYHQPPVVVHRPAIVYHQPPLIFHQPPPMVHQPVLKSHDTWISHPVVVPYSSRVMHHHTYVGVPDAYSVHHVGGYGNAFYKSHISNQAKSFVEKASQRNQISGEKNSTKSEKDSTKHDTKQNIASKLKTKKTGSQKGGKKNAVIVRRPPVIYHPPPEIYHRPEIVVHRAPIVIHRAPIIYHQPPVIVHRPAVVYHQPALVFHQPPPLVHQPIFRSHDTYVHRPMVRLYGSHLHHAGHFYHSPHAYYHGHGGIHYMAYGKSKVPQKQNIEDEKGDTRATVKSKKDKRKLGKSSKAAHHTERKHISLTRSKDKTETATKLQKNHDASLKHKITYHKAKEVTEKAHKKNSVVIHRPPIIYHPPPEIYHRPDIVVHRAPIVLYRAPIIYHQPPVVVHRPAIVYHQPPIVFHQPPPMVHQPVLHSHDTWVTKPVVIPYASHVRHVATYKGVPHEEIFMHGIGTGAFGKSRVPVRGTRRNKIDSVESNNKTDDEKTKAETEIKKPSDQAKIPETQGADDPEQHKAKNVKLGAKERIARALSDLLVQENAKPVGAAARIQRSLTGMLPLYGDQVTSTYASEFHGSHQGYGDIPEEAVGAASRIQRSIDDYTMKYQADAVTAPADARSRTQRALADPWTSFEGEKQYEMYKRSSDEETENISTPDENAEKNTNSTKKTLLIIRRPPILFHPPSHMIHRPSIVVHRPDIIVHRHPIIFHRPPILVHRPPIIIHRQPVLVHRPPIIVHRPPLVFHRPPIIIHRRPYIIHHHPILFHRPPIIIHRGPQLLVHHSHLIHHYPMHMIHMHCPGCGYGKSTVARIEGNTTDHDNNKTPHSDSTLSETKGKSSNKPKRSVVADKKSKKDVTDANHKGKRKVGHKKKKDVVVNRPPIIYHPPPEVYHRPDIVVHRAPILIHRPPIVYHQPPVVVHRPAVVYHQPPIVFHQPAPAVNQPLLFSHDNFVVHPMAFASHMGSVVNDAGHYVGLPHGGVSNFPGSIPHGLPGHVFPAVNSPSWARRTEVVKPQSEKPAKNNNESSHEKRLSEKGDQNGSGVKKNVKPTEQKSKNTKGERKNKVIVARPPMIYHPPPEIYDRPDIIVHRPDIVIHRPSVVYHQPSVVVHRAPVVYQQPPVVFHQPAPMVSQPVYHAHDTYVAHPVFHPHSSHIAHSQTYVGAPHFYPGQNSYGWGYGWGQTAHAPTAPTPQNGYTTSYDYNGYQGYTPSPTYGYSSYGPAYGRSEVEKGKNKKSKKNDKEMHNKDSALKKDNNKRKRRSAGLSKRHVHHHHHHHHHHHQHGHHHHRGSKRFYHFRPISSFAHMGHRKHVVIIHRPPLIYHPPPQVYRQPDVLMHLPPLVYHRPAIMFQQPPTIVHHPSIVYHQPPVVFHNPPPIVHTPVMQSHDMITPQLQHIMVPTSSYVHPAESYFGAVVPGQAYGKSHIEGSDAEKDSPKPKSVTDPEKQKEDQKAKVDAKREAVSTPETKEDNKGSKKQNVDLVVHQPPIVYHPPPDIFDKPPVVMHPPPMIVHRPPVLIHRAPVVVHRPPVIIHRPPIVLHQPTPVYHMAHGHFFHPFGRSKIANKSHKRSRKDGRRNKDKSSAKGFSGQKSSTKKGERKNLVVVHRPPMIYHPPPEIYDRPDVIVHRPDIVVHRPAVVYHQPSVVVHRPPIVYQQPPVVFHQPPPMVQQPVMHAHDTYVAHPVPVPYTSHVQHAATYVGAPQFGGYVGHAFGKSDVAKAKSKTKTPNRDKANERQTRDTGSSKKTNKNTSETSKGHKKNKVIIARPPMIYHPPPEIYDRPDVIVHRPDIVIHRPSIVYHQPSVVVHRPPIVYQQPPVVFHQPSPLVHQPILHAHDTYVAHPVPVPYSSHIQHTSTYVGSPHHFPGGWNYGWNNGWSNGLNQFHSFGAAYGKSKVPRKNSKDSKHNTSISEHKNKVRRAAKENQKKEDKEAKHKTTEKSNKKNQVLIQRPPLIYHPPPEVYHKPDVMVHRPDIVIHRPSVVYHQPSVVVHRPPVIYRQPPVVFHQPSPMVTQPVLHSHDSYLAHPYFTPYSSNVYHGGHYVGAPNFFDNGWGEHGYGFGHAFGKSKVEKSQKKHKIHVNKGKEELKGSRRTSEKEAKEAEDAVRLKNETKATTKGNKKNLVIMRRPPLIYHPPPEVYHKPDIILHRPDIVVHRPSIVFHQPSVVVHRPPVIYHQPPVVFHQPSPMVHQPIFHSHDTYLAHPHFVPFLSHMHHAESYVGAPHFYPGGWGWGHHGYGGGFHHAFGKSKVEKASKHHRESNENKKDSNGKRRTIKSTKHESEKKKDATKGHKKNLVVMHRPPLIYHPPPEIYHKPDIIVHRPDLVIHRPSIVFHQPSVVVHRPPVIYHQPPVVFHQPSPMVHQPIFHSHETYLAHPHFVPYMSHFEHAGSYVGAPHFFPGHWGHTHGFGHFMGHAFGKSKVEKGAKKEDIKKEENATPGKVPHKKTKRDNTEPIAVEKTKILKHIFSGAKKREHNKDTGEKADIKSAPLHPQKEDKKHHKKGHKKNMVIIQRPNLIYHPPPEIYDRPSIIVHRPDFVIHQPSIVYHQPSVVVHRPPIIYNPPPVVFHQPSPMVHQPMLTAHDIYHSHPQFVPYASHVSHAHTYVGAPHYYAGGWRYGNGYSDPSLVQQSRWNTWNGYRTPWLQSPSYRPNYFAATPVAGRRAMRGPYSSAYSKSHVQKHDEKPDDFSKTHQHNKQKHSSQSHSHLRKGERNTRSAESTKKVKSRLHKKGHHNGKGDKKNLVIMRRPPLIYHPPPEIYHKPDIVMHRPDIVIHRPSVVYHQPSVVVHRPPVVYRQPPVVFHQPAPMVNQPIFHAHESYMAHPAFVPYASHIQHSGTYVGAPQFYQGGWNYGYGHAYGKSHVLKHKSKSKQQSKKIEKKTKIESTKGNTLHPQEEKEERATRKNDIVVSRPPIIYHPPPEIYHRPDIVVHRAPIVLHRPPIIYHQPPVVVHRPAVVYHQPPVVFHQPPPTVHQPILHSHDSFVLRPAARFFPQGSTVTHSTSYVGIPNHVLHGDELDFRHFHRSKIEHSSGSRSSKRSNTAKSTISKIPTTNKENTETTITDQTQKKTLRSTIHHHKLGKRQLIGSHSLYGPESPINNIHDLYKSVEQNEKLSTIPGRASDRQSEVAKRSDESGYDVTKRQIIVPESNENAFRNILPPVYNALQAPAFQDQAEELPQSDGTTIEHLPGFASSLHDIQQLAGAGIARSAFPLALQHYLPTTLKEDSPDVRIHVETAKSSIPSKNRKKRQIFPILQQQGPAPISRVLFQPQTLGGLGGIHAAAPPSVYNLFSPYHLPYHSITDPLHYLQIPTQFQHRPHVNINVQSARSTIPDMEHSLVKRSKETKSKRQFLAIVPPMSPGIPLEGLRGIEGPAIMRNFPPYSPYSPLSRFLFPPLPRLSYPEETESEEPTFTEALHPAQHIHNAYSTLPEEESNAAPIFNPWLSYLNALYSSFLGNPLYHSHHKPRVHVDVEASKSHIPKAIKTENKQDVPAHGRISKRQLYNYLPDSTLTSHYTLPSAVNYGMPGFPFHRNSPHININVETAKKNGIPSAIKERRSSKVGSAKHREESKTGDKRDELVQGEENGQEFIPNGGNADFTNAPENQFVATNEAAQRVDETTPNANEQVQEQEEVSQQQPFQDMGEQRQELQENSDQQLSPTQGQPMMAPFQAQQPQQLAFGGNSAPVVPLQQSIPFQAPVQAPFVVPFQGMLPNALPGATSIPVSEQSNPQQVIQAEEDQPKHTSINVNVAAKSTVPKKKSKMSKSKFHKRQFITSTQGLSPAYAVPVAFNGAAPAASPNKPRVSINVQTFKKSAVENDNNKRASISLLTRFPAMQVLPQTFKQNGILMPAFNTLPINHRIKSNGMLLEELQRQRKHKIPQKAKSKIGGKKEAVLRSESTEMSNAQRKHKQNAKKRQFYAVPQFPLGVQQYAVSPQLKAHPRPHVSVNVEVNKRKSEFPQNDHHERLIDEKPETRDESNSKRQLYGMDQFPHMVQLPVVSAPQLSQIPLQKQRPRVSVHVEVAKKKNKLLSQKELTKEPPKKNRRQIYGLSELPHEGLPLQVASQDQALAYVPSTAHTPRISINVQTSKRSNEGSHQTIRKRQVFGLQPPLAQPFEQEQEQEREQEQQQQQQQQEQAQEQEQEPTAMFNDQEPLQTTEQAQGSIAQTPIHVQEEPQQDQSPFTDANSNPTVVQQQQQQQQQQAEDQSSNTVPQQGGLSETEYQRPHISVQVEASKRSKDRGQRHTKKNTEVKRKENAEKRQFQQTVQEPVQYEPEQEQVANAADPFQGQRPRVSVKVDVAKKKHNVAARKKTQNPAKRQFMVPFNGALNGFHAIQNTPFTTEKNQEVNEQNVQQFAMLPQSQAEVPEQQQQQQQQVMQPVGFVQPNQQQQQVQPFQQVMLPLAQTAEEKTRPKVSINIQTAKKDRVKSSSHHNKHTEERKSKRQLFGTVPLLSSLGQTTVPGDALKENSRSTVPQATKAQSTNIQNNRKDKRSWKRQLYNYLGGQQEQQILPTVPLQNFAVPQQQDATAQPVQVLGQDAGVQLPSVNLPQAPLLQTNEQAAPQPYLTQPEVPENNQQAPVSPIQPQDPSASPLGTFQRPHVSINVQTAKSHVPDPTLKNKASRSHLTTGKDRETKKYKRQFNILGGNIIERRRGPKFDVGPLKKPRQDNLLNLVNNLNKPVEVFGDPISNLVAGGAAGRKRPKLGGIRLDSPTGVGALPLKGAGNPLEGALPPDLGAPAILQDSPAQVAPPLAQEAAVGNEPLFRPPSGIAGPAVEALERGGAPNVPLPDLPPTQPAIFPLPAVNRAFLPVPGAPLPRANPLLLPPRIFPILPLAPPMAVPPVQEPPTLQQETAPELPQAPPQLAPMLPPFIPIPFPNTVPAPATPSPDSLFTGPEEDKPSVHVNVETSRSNVPKTEHPSTRHANGSAKRG